MKKNYLILIFSLMLTPIFGQVLNPSFENWTTKQNTIFVSGTGVIQGLTVDYEIDDPQFTYNEVVSWSSLNQLTGTESIEYPLTGSPLVELVTESTDASDGVKSIRLESRTIKINASVTIFGFQIDTSVVNVAPGLVVSGDFDLDEDAFANQLLNSTNLNSLNPFTYDGTGQAINYQPSKLMGSYKYTGLSGDSALMVSGLIKDRVVVAYVIKRLPNVNTWTDFELEYEYLSCEMPDTIISVFCSSNLDATFDNGDFLINSNYTGVNGSVLLIDDLRTDTLNPGSFPPIANNDNSSIIVDAVAQMEVTMNDDFCGDPVPTPTIVQPASNGMVVVLPNGDLEYTPTAGFSGLDTASYSVCNSSNLCDTALWIIQVNAVPLCVAMDDFRSLPSGGSSVFDATANDDDCGGDPNITVLPVNGIANVESNGDISYSPLVGFVGVDSLTYSICSPVNPAQCSTAKVYYEILTSIRDVANYTVKVSPNPAVNFVDISIDNKLPTNVRVFNMLGKEIVNTSFTNTTRLDLKNFVPGVYLIQMENVLGKATRKLVVGK